MKPRANENAASDTCGLPAVFQVLFGSLLALSLLKFGNPPIMEKYVSAPTGVYEFILGSPWPILWAYVLLMAVGFVGLPAALWRLAAPRWLLAMPLVWLGWQIVSATRSVGAHLSIPTVAHFTACVACFYLGAFSLSRTRCLTLFWLPIVAAYVLVLAAGWGQHFGGLEATRKYFFTYVYPELKEVPPEYIKKMSSTRIFSTLFYPNALAGALILLLPALLGRVYWARDRFTLGARLFLIGAIAVGSLACLYWSGSKGGWLIMLMLGMIVLLKLPFSRFLKVGLVSVVLVAGLAGFLWKYATFFQKGATSVGARFDYWQAAFLTAKSHPIFGTGPGTFAIPYQQLKRPESEMSRLVHNDYLEQASDSGIPGCLAYLLMVAGTLVWTSPRRPMGAVETPEASGTRREGSRPTGALSSAGRLGSELSTMGEMEWEHFLIWLGLLGWSVQGILEFGLYIPGLAWPAFALAGLLVGRSSRMRGPESNRQGNKPPVISGLA